MSRALTTAVPVLLTLLVACAQASAPAGNEAVESPPSPPPTPAAADEHGAVLGHVQTRDRRLTIRAGEDGPRFTVASLEGVVLARDLSETELLEHDRSLFDLVKSSRAFLDATMTLPETKAARFLEDRGAMRGRPLGDL